MQGCTALTNRSSDRRERTASLSARHCAASAAAKRSALARLRHCALADKRRALVEQGQIETVEYFADQSVPIHHACDY
jgi:hypothetical protein